ncbi:MAG: OmpA family protein [Methylococcaceae bacterium]
MITRNSLRSISLALLAFNLSGCVSLNPVTGHALSSTAKQRFSDDIIARDWTEIDALRERLAKIRPNAALLYAVARAEGLTEFGAIEYAENDQTGVLEPVLDDALRLLQSQEAGQTSVNLDFPVIAGIHQVRADLWQKTKQLKHDPAKLKCAGEAIARLEVGLLELAHEQYEVDVKLNTEEHTVPYIGFIDTLNKNLDEQLSQCADDNNPPKLKKKWVLSADALFYFDKYREQDILPDGKPKLNAFADKLKADIKDNIIPAQFKLIITGHTDRLGGHGYNLTLGQQRADTIRDYLIHQYHFLPSQIETRTMGYAQPITYCSGNKINAELKACLQPNRRVEIELRD